MALPDEQQAASSTGTLGRRRAARRRQLGRSRIAADPWPDRIADQGTRLGYDVAVPRWQRAGDSARCDRLQGLLLPLPRHGDGPARLAVRALERRHRAPDRRRARGRAATSTATGAPRAKSARWPNALRARRLGLDARRRRHPAPWLEARERLSSLPLGRLRRGAHPLRARPGLADSSDRSAVCYAAWCGSYEWKQIYGIDFLYAGPLFIHQLSHIWCDFRGIHDRFMREHDSDYFENSRRATLDPAAVRDPQSARLQARTASMLGHHRQRRARLTKSRRSTASSAPSTTTSRAACPTAPTTARSRRGPWRRRFPSRPKSSPRPSRTSKALHINVPIRMASRPRSIRCTAAMATTVGWVSPYHFGINEGPTVLMIENHRAA